MSRKPCGTTSATAPGEHYYFGFRSCHNRNKWLPEYVTINIEWPLWVIICVFCSVFFVYFELHLIQCCHLGAFSYWSWGYRKVLFLPTCLVAAIFYCFCHFDPVTFRVADDADVELREYFRIHNFVWRVVQLLLDKFRHSQFHLSAPPLIEQHPLIDQPSTSKHYQIRYIDRSYRLIDNANRMRICQYNRQTN